MRRRILVTIVLVATLAVLAFFVPAPLAVRSRIQRGELLELQREASIVATPDRRRPERSISPSCRVDSVHDLALYDHDRACWSTATARRPPTRSSPRRSPASRRGHTSSGDLVAAAADPHRRRRPRARRARHASRRAESDARVRASVLLLALAAVAIIAVAGARRRPARPAPEPPDRASCASGRRRSVATTPKAAAAATGHRRARRARQRADRRRRPHPRAAAARAVVLVARRRTSCARRWRRCASPIEAELDAPRPTAPTVLHESLGALDRLESTIDEHAGPGPPRRARRRRGATSARSSRDHAERWRPSYAAAGRRRHRARRRAAGRGRRRGRRPHPRRAARERPRPRRAAPVVVIVRRTGSGRSRSTSATTGRRTRRRPVLRAARPTPATASGCAWPARWPSPRAASSRLARGRRRRVPAVARRRARPEPPGRGVRPGAHLPTLTVAVLIRRAHAAGATSGGLR